MVVSMFSLKRLGSGRVRNCLDSLRLQFLGRLRRLCEGRKPKRSGQLALAACCWPEPTAHGGDRSCCCRARRQRARFGRLSAPAPAAALAPVGGRLDFCRLPEAAAKSERRRRKMADISEPWRERPTETINNRGRLTSER